MSTHDRLAAFLDAHQQEHAEAGTLCTNLCLAAAFAAGDDDEPCEEFGSHPRGKHDETAAAARVTPPEVPDLCECGETYPCAEASVCRARHRTRPE